MASNFSKGDPIYGSIDLDDEYITDAWLIDRFVGSSIWSWGYNANGQLGLGDIVDQSSPVQVGILTNWKLVSSGQYHSSAINFDEV
jgi:hypothetical protein